MSNVPPPEGSPAEAAARDVVERLQKSGHVALYAGGCVRDKKLGRPANDYDVATSALPGQVRRLFKRTLRVGEQFGIIIVLSGDQQTEVATFRSDGEYTDGRRPEQVVYTDDPKVDASRRDFTINGLFYDPISGEVTDHVDGLADLERGLVRAIGDPAKRFDEDKLRILRAPRFAAMLGFEIEEQTAAQARAHAEEIRAAKVSQERIKLELDKILGYPTRARGVALCHDLNVLAVVLPEALSDVPRACRALEAIAPDATRSLAWATLLHLSSAAQAEAALRRLRSDNKRLKATVALLTDLEQARRFEGLELADQKLLLRRHTPDLEELVHAVTLAAGEVSQASQVMASRRATWSADAGPAGLSAKPLLGGRDLQQAGIKAGPAFGRVLPQIERAQLEGRVATREEALALALELLDPE